MIRAAAFLLLALVCRVPARAADETALDAAISGALKARRVPGAVVALVRKGQPPLVRGYGFADVARQRPVDPERTGFQACSVSKVFCAAAVLQLVEAGKLDLDRDVNAYIDFVIPPRSGPPITLRRLLTHSSGLSDRYIGISSRTAAGALPLRDYLASWIPPRLWDAGDAYTYSNWGVALAGYIVERAAGVPFAEYMRTRVLEPVGMTHSSFDLSPRILADAAVPYLKRGSASTALSIDYLLDSPAGMLISSGADMARFIAWELDRGAAPEFQRQFSNHPDFGDAAGLGWGLWTWGAHPDAGHSGGYIGASSNLTVFLKDGLGFYIACNTASDEFLSDVYEAIRTTYLTPAPAQEEPRPREWNRGVARFRGFYRQTRTPHAELIKLGLLSGTIQSEARVREAPDGLIEVTGDGRKPRRYAQVAPLSFRSMEDGARCAFRQDASGRIRYFFAAGTLSYERIPWHSTRLAGRLTGGATLLFVCALLLVPVRRRLLPEPLRRPAALVCGLFLAHFAGLGAVFAVFTGPDAGYLYGLPWPVRAVQCLPFAALAAVAWFAWRMAAARRPHPAGLAALAVFALHLWWLNEWCALGFRF